MSIWCSWRTIGEAEDSPESDGSVLSYASGWANHYPREAVETPAGMEIAHAPAWCVPGHQDGHDNDGAVGDVLRLSIDAPDAMTWRPDGVSWPDPVHGSVILTEGAARLLHKQLGEWLAMPKVHPS
jgi:hypothetical protein